jgi:GTP diphosphokinase / guanosine-3',5'-bis(diphosphate) 3'-diphosphatase
MSNDLRPLTEGLLNKVPNDYKNLVLECIEWAQKEYAGHDRLSGENSIFHALRVANTAGDLHLDTDSIITSILHCVLNDEHEKNLERMEKEIEEKFGENVSQLLKTLQKINQGTDSEETGNKIITRYVLRNSEDIRPILIKIFDVLDDVRTIEYLPEEAIKLKAKKVFDIYGPLCSYLNLEPLKKEIEEIVFKHTKPEEYIVIEEKMKKENLDEELLDKYIKELENVLDILDYKPKIYGRIKSKYSMYNKLKKLENEGSGTALSQIKDRIAISIITQSKDDCFLVKMALEEKTKINEEYTDDYISEPKPNGFQALQMSVCCEQIKDIFIEIQILTHKMYYINTYGPASHIAYKASKHRFAKPTDSFNWLEVLHKQIINCQSLSNRSRSVPIKADIFKNYIYIFTPKGRIIELGKGATALDFAYRVHTRVGHNATFSQINGETKDLSTELETGDIVNIITSNQDKYPNRDWLKFADADSTKEKIRKALKNKSTIEK